MQISLLGPFITNERIALLDFNNSPRNREQIAANIHFIGQFHTVYVLK